MTERQRKLTLDDVLNVCAEYPEVDLYYFHSGDGLFGIRYTEESRFVEVTFPDISPKELVITLIKKAKQELWKGLEVPSA